MRIRRLHIHADRGGCGGPGACDDEGVDVELGHSMTVLTGLHGEARAALAQLIDLAALEAGPTPHLAGGLSPATCVVTADDLRPGPGTALRPSRAERERLLGERAHLEAIAAEYAHQIGTLVAERRTATNPLSIAEELLQTWRATAERTAARRLMTSSLLASWPPPARRTAGPDPQVVALAQLHANRAQLKVDRLRETAHRFALAAGDRSGVEAVHAQIETSERAVQKRGRASGQARLAQLRTQEVALLSQLGFTSWVEYRLASRAAPDEVFIDQIRQAETDAAEAADQVASLQGAAGQRDPALEPLRRRARGVLGEEHADRDDESLVDGLRDVLTDTSDVDTARLALEVSLDAAGAPPAKDPAVRWDALLADHGGELPWRSPETEAALACDEERVTLEAALAETREQIAILDAHVALAARRTFPATGTADDDLELALLRQVSVLRRDGYPLVVDDAFAGRPESLVRTVLSTLEDLAREIQVIVLTEEQSVESWGRSIARTRVALVDVGWDADVATLPGRVQVVVDAGMEVDLVGGSHVDPHRSGRERCRRCWAIDELEPSAECRRKTCATCLVGPTRFHGRLCVDCALVAAGVRARKVRR